MKVLTIVLLMIVTVLVLTSVSTLIYMAYFKHVLNRRIAEGKSSGRHRLIEPLKFFLVSFLVLTLLGFVFLMCSSFRTGEETDIRFEQCDDSPLALISPDEEIPGYRRFTKSDEGVELVWYVKDSDNKSFPDILIYVEADEAYEYSFSSDGSELVQTGKSDEKSRWYSAENIDCKSAFKVKTASGEISVGLE